MPFKITTHTDENGRVCTKCKEYKLWDNFSRCSATVSWYTPNCKQCRKETKTKYLATWYWHHKTRNSKIVKRANICYREKEVQKHREWVEKNREHINAYNRERYRNKKER